MIPRYTIYKALKKQLGDTQIGNNAVKEIQRFMNDSLNEACSDVILFDSIIFLTKSLNFITNPNRLKRNINVMGSNVSLV